MKRYIPDTDMIRLKAPRRKKAIQPGITKLKGEVIDIGDEGQVVKTDSNSSSLRVLLMKGITRIQHAQVGDRIRLEYLRTNGGSYWFGDIVKSSRRKAK